MNSQDRLVIAFIVVLFSFVFWLFIGADNKKSKICEYYQGVYISGHCVAKTAVIDIE